MSAQHWSLRLFMATVALAGFAAVFNAHAQQDEKPLAILFAAGDIATCTTNADRSGQTTADLIKTQIAKARETFPGVDIRILALGDLAYPHGSVDDFKCFDETWGQEHKSMILPAPGNHDLETQGGRPYFEYFKATFEALEADKALATYATGLPTSAGTDAPWLLVALNSNKSTGASGDQVTWLKDVLTKATKAKCVLAFAHAPLYSSGRHGHADKNGKAQNSTASLDMTKPLRPEPTMRALFETLHAGGASLALFGHDHHYEQLGRADAKGKASDRGQSAIVANGVRSFIVGTGGTQLHSEHPKGNDYNEKWAFQEAYDLKNRGVLRIELRPTSYAWEFLPTRPSHLVKHSGFTTRDGCNRP